MNRKLRLTGLALVLLLLGAGAAWLRGRSDPPVKGDAAMERQDPMRPGPAAVMTDLQPDDESAAVDGKDLSIAVPLQVPRVPDEPLPKAEMPPAPPATSEQEPPPDDPAPADPTPPEESALISPVLLRAAWVPYPGSARRKKMEGLVEVRVRVEEDGGVSAVDVISASPDSSLNRAAMESALTMKFKPASQGGRPVAAWYHYRFDFKLPES